MTFKEFMDQPHPELEYIADMAEQEREADEEAAYDRRYNITPESAAKQIQAHNASIDTYINTILASELGAKKGMISAEQWFKAQPLIKAQGFYEKGKVIQDVLRSAGFDVKMNMQNHKLVCSRLI